MAVLTPSQQLKGHTAPVLCLAHQKESCLGPSVLASGAEDNTCRLWDLRTHRAVKGIKNLDDPVTSIAFPSPDTPLLYLSSGTKVLTYDLRQPGMILTEALREYNFSNDEINAIAINKKNSFLATADDEGDVHIVDLSTHKLYKKQIKSHSSICMSVKFHPRKAWEVWSGGSDSKVIHRDFSKGRPLDIFNMADIAPSSNQMFNPPFVYALDVSPHGDWLAAGLGDASIQLVQLTDQKYRALPNAELGPRLLDGHSYMVSCLSFFASNDNDEPFLLSGSANGSLALWDLKDATLQHTFEMDPASMTRLNAVLALPGTSGEQQQCVAAGVLGAQGTQGALNVYNLF
ncbi:WD40 repeat-like protein [Hesseltinella vesiculosa]|uniref:WD40 repeat-like protein n=1 Tax=Hesseltinella vesiculosa TaxID=101127 RepID=A0A1X2GMX4_9FUNG|nr:WD40 repeat-like protein [Hesseltinella vesiculosa]